MGQNTEEKLKIEGEILNLKRELKYATENLARVKADTQDVINTKERITKEIGERNDDLTRILNEISDQKLAWALERQGQLDEIANKRSEADNILKRKGELNEQEERIRKIEQSEISARNEARQLELKVKDEKDIVNAERRRLEDDIKEFEKEKVKFAKDKENFKEKVIKVIKTVENL
jgi:chromosome segregation ATPase